MCTVLPHTFGRLPTEVKGLVQGLGARSHCVSSRFTWGLDFDVGTGLGQILVRKVTMFGPIPYEQ